jgi:hypothetical protein
MDRSREFSGFTVSQGRKNNPPLSLCYPTTIQRTHSRRDCEIYLMRVLSRIGSDRVRGRWAASFRFHLDTSLFPAPKGIYVAFIEIASPDHHLIGIVDVIDRRHLAARKLLPILMGQHLQPWTGHCSRCVWGAIVQLSGGSLKPERFSQPLLIVC